ncbi:MAG: isoprenyl transferase [Candidatus Symbiothrix sp.]|nr:isoprenyl transferase [Candidatus Symbiothrix sp.]
MKEQIDLTRLPQHVAIIMDGNGRWAQQHGMERYMGHQEGAVSVRKIVEAAGEIGVKYLTLYAFSTENWNRPQTEVDALMALLITTIQRETPDLMSNNVRLHAIGDLSRLPKASKDELDWCIATTAKNTGLNLVLALSYSSRWEITDAVKQIAAKIQNRELNIHQIDEQIVSQHLTTRQLPDPDLLIRTGGEQRISNYLLWQLAYAELYFTPVYWPDFREKHFFEAIIDYQNRERRFGKTGEQIKNTINN